MPLPTPKFDGQNLWNGTTPRTRPNVDTFVHADGEIAGRHSSEIIELQEQVKQIIEDIDIIRNIGPPNSFISVESDQYELEYKTLVEGTGIEIEYDGSDIIISLEDPISTNFSYVGGSLTTVTNANGTKTFTYNGSQLETLSNTETQTLSTFGYTDGKLTSITVTPL